MFKGLKRAIQGGAGAIAEKGQDLASNVVNDQEFSTTAIKDKLKETTKRTYKEGKILYREGGQDIRDKVGSENVDKLQGTTKDTIHNIKHYGAFGEDLLGYSDPQKELRKAVKAKEKAAKKAKKAKKKKGEKVEDLFDPANLAKYKKELEEKRKAAAPVSPGTNEDGDDSNPLSPNEEPNFEQQRPPPKQTDTWSPAAESDEFDFGLQEGQSRSQKADEPENDWAKFQALTSGVDAIVKQKKDDLDTLKETSYYQRKKTGDELAEDIRIARPTNLEGVGEASEGDSDDEEYNIETRRKVLQEAELHTGWSDDDKSPDFGGDEVEEEKQEESEDEEKEEEEEFDTEFVNETLATLGLKLNEIPDSPIDDGPDVFDTQTATDIVEKTEKERKLREKVESDKVRIGMLASAADVLSGRAAAPAVAEHSIVRKRRRRGDGVNLLPEEPEPPAVVEEPKVDENPETEDKVDGEDEDKSEEEGLENGEKADDTENDDFVKVEEPQEVQEEEEEEEEDDPFDAAFDELAKESLKKVNMEELTAELYNEDLFDTSAADAVLNLASLTNVVEEKEEEIVLDTFDDKDPFDTSAYDHITKDLEEDLEFESLAKRDPNETVNSQDIAEDPGTDPFETVENEIANNLKEEENDGWAAFDQVKRKKPSRPPPPRPPPPRPPSRPKPPAVNIDYASGRNTPAVIIKAPSTESVQSWNVTQSDTLIIKCNIEALEASALENEDEIDPFDTTEYEGIVKELKAQSEDPFDTTHLNLEPSKTELKIIEKELLEDKKTEEESDTKDPFDTEHVKEAIPKEEVPEDPFDTGEPETKEDADDDFDPFDTTVADKVIPIRSPKISQKSTISIEDDDFDPNKAFSNQPKESPAPPPRPGALPVQEYDPFATREGTAPPVPVVKKVRPEHQVKIAGRSRPKTLAQIEAERKAAEAAANISDDDFDPRADTPEEKPKTPEVPETPESPDPFNTDGIDPFDTSAVAIEE